MLSDYNVCAESIVNQPAATSSPIITTLRKNQSPSVENRTSNSISQLSPSSIDRSSISVEHTNDNNNSVYQNFDVAFHNTTYNNRETLICDGSLNRAPASSMPQEPRENYYNFVAIANDANRLQQFERSHSMRTTTNNETNSNDTNGLPTPNHGRTQSLIERKTTSTLTRKIPENLKLNDSFANNTDPLPSVITSSGPYIAISECISGNPLIDRDNPMTPLNSLDPKFYETPRSHINNIGLNLTNEQPYSPKRNNCPTVSLFHSKSIVHVIQVERLASCRLNRREYREAAAPAPQIRKVYSPMTRNGPIRARLMRPVIENCARPTVRSKTIQLCLHTHTVSRSYDTKKIRFPMPPRLACMCIHDGRGRSPVYCWKRMTMMNATKKLTHRIRKMHRRPLHLAQKIILRYVLRSISVLDLELMIFSWLFCSALKKTMIFRGHIICLITI